MGVPILYGVPSPMFLGVIVGRVPISAGLSSPGIQNHSVSTFDLVLISLTRVPTNSKNVPESLLIIPRTADESVKNRTPLFLDAGSP
jgi:hypothetical protein